MKKVFESDLYGFDESASRVHVYAFEEEEEAKEFYNLDHEQKCEVMGVFDEMGYCIEPGGKYRTYGFCESNGLLIMIEMISLNV